MVGLCQRPSAISVWIQEMNVGAQWRKKTNNTYTHHYGIRFGMRFEAIKNDEQRNIQTWTQALTIAALHTISFAQTATATNNSCLFISICIKNFHLKCCFILKDKLKEKTQPPTIWKIDLFFLICVSYSLSHAIIFHTAANNAINATQITGREKKLYNRVSFTLHHRSIEHLFRTWINLKKVYWHWMLQPMHATSFPCGLIECSIGVRSKEMSYTINESAIGMCIYRLLLLIDRLPHIRVHFGVWFS